MSCIIKQNKIMRKYGEPSLREMLIQVFSVVLMVRFTRFLINDWNLILAQFVYMFPTNLKLENITWEEVSSLLFFFGFLGS